MHLQISMGGAQKWKRPPKHFYTGLAGEGCTRIPQAQSLRRATSASQTCKGMDKAQTRARDWGVPKNGWRKAAAEVHAHSHNSIDPAISQEFSRIWRPPASNQNIWLSLLRHVQPGALPELVQARWNGGIERKLEPHALMWQCPLRFPCRL